MGAHVGDRPIEGNYVAIGWNALGDIQKIGVSREAFKEALTKAYPDMKLGAVPGAAGTLYKFAHEFRIDDIVIYPSKLDRMVNIGRVKGQFNFHETDKDENPNRQNVEWLAHCPRSEFSQGALNEIGSAITLFKVKRYAHEFLEKIGEREPELGEAIDEETDDDLAVAAAATLAETSARDFVINSLMSKLSGHQFEEFIAHLMECMGYTTRLTPKSGDGGVDVIAHMDPLGFQPPIVKVQCKRTTSQTSRPEIDNLLGTLGVGEYGLFINLGSFVRGAIESERHREKLRLINGEQLVDLVFEHYENLSPRYRSMIPLKRIFVPDLGQNWTYKNSYGKY
jgi:restriction system protein